MPNRSDPDTPGRGAHGGPVLPPGLQDLPVELPHCFLGLEGESASWEHSKALILPVPWESTTSYGGGTRSGPKALIEASRYIELYDQEHGVEVGPAIGVHTLPQLELTRAGPAEAMAELEEAYRQVVEAAGDRFITLLGGEHAVSAPAIRVWGEKVAAEGGRLSVLQLDAHADLRPQYEGSPHSHASAMARILDVADVTGVGLRAVSQEEVEVAEAHEGVHLIWADEMWENDDWMEAALARLGDPVYITYDIDYLDPSLMPSTGTPEPGGGDWYRTNRFLKRVFAERSVLACDVVELAPIPGLHAPDFLAAKLVYKLLGYRFSNLLSAGR